MTLFSVYVMRHQSADCGCGTCCSSTSITSSTGSTSSTSSSPPFPGGLLAHTTLHAHNAASDGTPPGTSAAAAADAAVGYSVVPITVRDEKGRRTPQYLSLMNDMGIPPS
jgi:hypothetical protein